MKENRRNAGGQADDDALMRELGRMLRTADPAPQQVRAGARGLLTWQTVDAGLSELLRGGTTSVPPASG
jgi:hypothetical protein